MGTSYFLNRDQCPACTSNNLRAIYRSPYDEPAISDYLHSFYSPQGGVELEFLQGAEYVLDECEVCGLIFQREIPNDTLMERLYEHWIDPKKSFDRYERQNDLLHYVLYAREIIRLIAYFGKLPSALSFLDFGMGWGRWALMASAFGCDSYGTELSETRIKYAQAKGIKVIAWDEIPQYRFDFINTEQVFEHIPEPLQTLRHLKTALKPGGIIKVSVPEADDIKRRLRLMDWKAPKDSRNSLNPVAPLEHINFFRTKSLTKMARAAGMEEVFIPIKLQFRYSFDWGGIKQVAKNFLGPIYRNILRKGNYRFFRKVQPDKS